MNGFVADGAVDRFGGEVDEVVTDDLEFGFVEVVVDESPLTFVFQDGPFFEGEGEVGGEGFEF